jgi:uncharacterized protein (TIGR02231 family)
MLSLNLLQAIICKKETSSSESKKRPVIVDPLDFAVISATILRGGSMATLTANSKIDSVIVYSDRVLVTRTLKVDLKKTIDIEIPDLPGALDDQSIRTRAQDLQIGEVQVRTGYKKEIRPEEKAIEQKVKKLNVEDRTLADEHLVLQEKQKFLDSITVTGPEVISSDLFTGKVAPEAWRQGLAFIGEEMIAAKIRIAEIERLRTDIKEKIDALNRELHDIKTIHQNRKTVVFDVHPKHEKEYTIELSYLIYGGGWRTYYELRADMNTKKVTISYFGKVLQRTGEDWDDVRMTLSTAQPVLGGAAPEPYPWYIDLYMPRPKRTARMESAKSAPAPAGAAADMKMDEELQEAAPLIDTGIAISYPLADRFSIKSGEPEKKVLITNAEVTVDFEYFIVPRRAEHAFSTGTFNNTSGYLFLAGDANTYVGDDFTGQMTIDTIAPDDEATLSFGIDDRVKVERKTKKRQVSKGGLVKKATKYDHEHENTITNLHKKEISCKVVDQIPVAQNPDIKVGNVHIEPKATKEEKEQGLFEWHFPIPPGEKYVITVGFSVEAPYDAQVEGLA